MPTQRGNKISVWILITSLRPCLYLLSKQDVVHVHAHHHGHRRHDSMTAFVLLKETRCWDSNFFKVATKRAKGFKTPFD